MTPRNASSRRWSRPHRRCGPASADDTGSGTVWVLTLCLLLWCAAFTVSQLAGVRIDRQRASSAADLAALAGARKAALGATDACAAVRATAAANGARAASCRLSGLVIDTRVELPVRGWQGTLTAEARAGPATGPGPDPPNPTAPGPALRAPAISGPDPPDPPEPAAPAPGPGHGPDPPDPPLSRSRS